MTRKHSHAHIILETLFFIVILFVAYFVIASLGFFQGNFGFALSNTYYAPQSLSLSGSQILALAVCNWKFYITDATTGSPIANARIELYWNDPLAGNPMYNTYTNAAGYASLGTVQYQYTYVTLQAQGYLDQTIGPIDSRGSLIPTLTFHWTMQKGVSGANNAALTIYAQADDTTDGITASVTLGGNTYYLDLTASPEHVVVWNLMPNMTYSVEVKGTYYHDLNGVAQKNSFDWVNSYSTGGNNTNTEFWLEVISGIVQGGKPPVPPPNPIDVWQWLLNAVAWAIQYWYVVVGAGVAVYLSPWWLSALGKIWVSKATRRT